MGAEAKIVLSWLMFGGTHIIGSSIRVRTYLIETLGLICFKVLYSVIAFATFLPLCYVYFLEKHAGIQLFTPTIELHYLAQALILFSFITLFQGLMTLNTQTTLAELTGRFPEQARGIQRITRHPQNFSFSLLGIAHCLVLPFVGDWLFFGGFVVYGVLSALHQDRRARVTGPEAVKQFQAETSFVPFAAILTGKQRLAFSEYHVIGVVVALGLYITLSIFHGLLFGGFGG
jgi:uncharacterized membrane protein